jgi:hypothetical protein
LLGPEGFVEQLLHLVMRLIQVHRDLFLNHLALLVNVTGVESRMQKHVHQHIQQRIEAIVAGAGVKTGRFFTGKRVEITANALDGLRNFAGGAPFGSLEQEVFDEMTDPVQARGFVT